MTLTPLVDGGCEVLEQYGEVQIRTEKHNGNEDEYERNRDEDTLALDRLASESPTKYGSWKRRLECCWKLHHQGE